MVACNNDGGGSIFTDSTDSTLTANDDEASDATTNSSTDTEGPCNTCEANIYTPCEGDPVDCGELGEVCVEGQGCVPCIPGEPTCEGNSVVECDENGQPGELIEDCDSASGSVCAEGECVDACAVADDTPSNIGCEFWAVDLPNSRGIDDASTQAWGVVLANAGETPASVIIERNIAELGEPESLFVVAQTTIPSGELETIELPRAELTGWTEATEEPPGPPGTWKSNNAFRITATAPIVVYQFNTFTNDFSNDASLLLPSSGLGKVHRAIGYATANPIAPIPIAGIPDRSSVTVVAIEDGTNIEIRPGTTTLSDMVGIPVGMPGQPFDVYLNRWEVVNIASSGIPGDMTGTVVEADKPVAVFSSGERAIAPTYDIPGMPEPPNWDGELCCTDHIEEQVFPASSLGSQFVITHSPERSGGGWVEPDLLRFMAVAEPASVTTSLPPPRDQFELQPGEVFDTWAQEDFVVESSTPIMVAQILVSQGYTMAFTGDPALTYFPSIDQYRERYVFLTPPSWTSNYFVLSTPYEQGGDGPSLGNITLDGGPLPDGCVEQAAGTLEATEYWSIVCPVGEGAHLVEGDNAFGLTVYGYGPAGSYAYTGGADVKPIYEVPPIP